MKKKLLFAAALAAMLASCSESFEAQQPVAPSQTPAVAGETPVGFGIYTNRGTQGTRGGATGALSTEALKDANGEIGQAGFGVFAYNTDNLYYTGSTKPNFMYNQQVTYAGAVGAWTYEPVKYWPNEYGSHVESADEDKVSFFAYAPYFACDPATGNVADAGWGISGFSKNTASGDPIVRYTTSFDLTKQVDLCWAVKNSGTWATLTDQKTQNIANGYAWKDVEHPATIEQKMTFHFRHATAQLNVQIDADADIAAHQGGSAIDGKTKVYVRSVTFKGFAQRGALNLNNTASNQPLWLNFNGQGELQSAPVVINDGRRDGKEGKTANTSEANPALNPYIIQTAEDTIGVTGTLQNLFSVRSLTGSSQQRAEAPIYVIPTGEDALTVTIAYDVETASANLAGYLSDGRTHGYSVQNVITKEITFGSNNEGLKAGNNYQVKLHLGLNSVKFDAAVSDWADGDDAVAGLPGNGPADDSSAAATTPTTLSQLKDWINAGNASDDTYLGYYVKANGDISTDDTDAIGVVAYYGDAAVDASATDSRILVLATADASGSAQWKTSMSGGESAYNDPDALNGIAFTEAYGDNAVYRAAQAAKVYSATRPTGASIWFLPSKGQWTKMIDAGHTGNASGGYWSSTEDADGTYAWEYTFGDYSWWFNYPKNYWRKVRAAFVY
ncbi:MAG: hypothetical protein J6E43_07505 [Prevotella sp.]|nr:hypothetical protein [Prevotella sp.]MBP3850645.1 hypothetical protein [Prevotella sp.]